MTLMLDMEVILSWVDDDVVKKYIDESSVMNVITDLLGYEQYSG